MEPNTLSLEAAAVLDAITHGPRAWATLEQITEASGLSADDVTEVLDSLTGAGLIEPWPSKKAWTLSPLSASRLGLEIKASRYGALSWGSIDARESSPQINQDAAEEHAMMLQTIPDREPRWSDVDDIPCPSLILATRPGNWTERPASKANAKKTREGGYRCLTCQGRWLPGNAYCAECSRWGQDRNFVMVEKLARVRETNAAINSTEGKKRERRDILIAGAIRTGANYRTVAKTFGISISTVSLAARRILGQRKTKTG